MLTSIQLSEQAKNALGRFKNTTKQTYEEVILNLIKIAEIQKRKQEKLLIEECKEMAKENLRIAKEWEGTLMDGLDRKEKWEELEEGI